MGEPLGGDHGPRFLGRHDAAVGCAHSREVDRHRIDAPARHREDAVTVVGELREALQIAPDGFGIGVEDVRAVAMHLDAAVGIDLRIGVAADVGASVEHTDGSTEPACHLLGDGRAEEARRPRRRRRSNRAACGPPPRQNAPVAKASGPPRMPTGLLRRGARLPAE